MKYIAEWFCMVHKKGQIMYLGFMRWIFLISFLQTLWIVDGMLRIKLLLMYAASIIFVMTVYHENPFSQIWQNKSVYCTFWPWVLLNQASSEINLEKIIESFLHYESSTSLAFWIHQYRQQMSGKSYLLMEEYNLKVLECRHLYAMLYSTCWYQFQVCAWFEII